MMSMMASMSTMMMMIMIMMMKKAFCYNLQLKCASTLLNLPNCSLPPALPYHNKLRMFLNFSLIVVFALILWSCN